MSLAAGTRLASFEILGPLGKGGMGEVYRARDIRLQREVALKLLPDKLLSDPERVLRFEREAKVLAALNHPHIATVYGVVEHNTSVALAMELVDGPTLAERLKAGPIPLEDAFPIARQIAEALEYAHDRGVIHRDLKPANIKLTSEDTVKVLDFGLAKVLDVSLSSGVGTEKPVSDLTSSPTEGFMGTRAGAILGTAVYMSPEQARGKAVDRRSDIWSFGCVLYEMLTRARPFFGETTTDTLAAIVRAEPDWSRIPPGVPARVQDLLHRCLRKDVRSRLQSIGDARVLLEEVANHPEERALDQAPRSSVGPTPRWRTVLPWALAGLIVVGAIAFFWSRKQPDMPFPPMAAALVTASELEDPAISPDGRAVVYVHGNALWLRKLDELEPHSLAGTEGAYNPFWSSDSRSIGYFSQAQLRVIPTGGGVSRVLWQLTGNQDFTNGTWSGDRIVVRVVSPNALYEVPTDGSAAKLIAKPEPAKNEYAFGSPRFLPDGKALVMTIRPDGYDSPPDTLAVQQGSDRRVILRIPGAILVCVGYSPASGDLLFEKLNAPNDGLWAVPFSLSKLQVSGPPLPIQASGMQVSVSLHGTLVYINGLTRRSELAWIDRDGKILQHLGTPEHGISQPAVAPDGVRVAVDSKSFTELQVHDTRRNVAVKINRESGTFRSPQWTPDGKKLAFLRAQDRGYVLSLASPDGTGTVHEIPLPAGEWNNFSFAPDGKSVLLDCKQDGTWGICKMAVEDGAVPEKLIFRPGTAASAQLSADGRFIAYSSNESGVSQVYVQPFPTGEGRWQVSTTGGAFPQWNPNGKELAYLDGQKLMVVPVEAKSGFVPGSPRSLFSGVDLRTPMQWFGDALYDYSADGQKFLIVRSVTNDLLEIVAVQNWQPIKKTAP